MPVLSTALYQRFSSRGEADFQDKLLSAMRFQFGGHLEKPRQVTTDGEHVMDASHSDALAFFGATGDLAYKKIFPALQAMVKRGHLDRAGHRRGEGRLDARSAPGAGEREHREARQLRSGRLREALGAPAATSTGTTTIPRRIGPSARRSAPPQRPAHYLAIPPVLFGTVVEQLGTSGCATSARVIVEKPFGTDLGSARKLNGILLGAFSETAIFRIDHYLGQAAGPQHALLPLHERVHGAVLEPHSRRACRSRWRRTSASRAAARSTTQTGTIRDVVQNHLFQVLANLAMEPPVRTDSESIRDEKVEGAEGDAVPRRDERRPRTVPRLQEREGRRAGLHGRDVRGRCSLEIDSWRWQGVPFYIRAGKCLPVTCTEILVRLRRPPTEYPRTGLASEPPALPDQPRGHDRARHERHGARGGDGRSGRRDGREPPRRRRGDGCVRARARRRDGGDATLFAREDYVEEAWRVVDPMLAASTPVYEYEPGTWGPREAEAPGSPGAGTIRS